VPPPPHRAITVHVKTRPHICGRRHIAKGVRAWSSAERALPEIPH
jgi:hypothetical protein